MLQLLVTNAQPHRLEVPLCRLVSNSSNITVVNVGEDKVYLKVQNYVCNQSSVNLLSEPVPIESMHTAWLKLRAEVTYDTVPQPFHTVTPRKTHLSTSLEIAFYSQRPQPGDQTLPGSLPDQTESVQCVVTLPAGLPEGYTLHQEVYFATFPNEPNSVLEEERSLASIEAFRQN
jgi:hypothetical protein